MHPEAKTCDLHLTFLFRVTQGDSWALCPTVSAVSQASMTLCTNTEDL